MLKESADGFLAYSLAGHDKGSLYVIIRTEGDLAYVADGRLKKLEKPKKKKLKHLQIVKKRFDELLDEAEESVNNFDNERIKRSIGIYLRKGKEAF